MINKSHLPLLDEGANLVGGHVHAVEVGKAALARDIQDLKLNLTVVLVLVLVEVGEVSLADATLQELGGDTHTGTAGHQCLANIADLKNTTRQGSAHSFTCLSFPCVAADLLVSLFPVLQLLRADRRKITHLEGRRGLDVIPVLLGEGVYLLLSLTLLTLTKALVLPAKNKRKARSQHTRPKLKASHSERIKPLMHYRTEEPELCKEDIGTTQAASADTHVHTSAREQDS